MLYASVRQDQRGEAPSRYTCNGPTSHIDCLGREVRRNGPMTQAQVQSSSPQTAESPETYVTGSPLPDGSRLSLPSAGTLANARARRGPFDTFWGGPSLKRVRRVPPSNFFSGSAPPLFGRYGPDGDSCWSDIHCPPRAQAADRGVAFVGRPSPRVHPRATAVSPRDDPGSPCIAVLRHRAIIAA